MPKEIFLPKWTELLVALYNTPDEQRYCGKLYKKTGITIRHLRVLIAGMEENGIITRGGNGKIKYLTLTDKGVRLAESFLQITPALKR